VKRRFILATLLAFAAGGGWLAWRYRKARSPSAIAARGGRELHLRLPDPGHTFLQKDPRWAEDKLGSTAGTLGGYGCTICSVAMAATALGHPVTPQELNNRLRDSGGFTESGWLIWGALPKATSGAITATVTPRPTHADIDTALERGAYPIIKFILLTGISHWVIIVGKDGLDYLVRDPLVNEAEPVKLSSRTRWIESVRVIGRAPSERRSL
jgi:hypothetical protein